MLTKADDYPIHQLPEPVAVAGSDRNFYDRYFFNAQAPDGSCYAAAALGVYPHLNIIDAAVCVMENGAQRSVFASRLLNSERLDIHAGPIRVDVLEPLQRLKVTLAETDGVAAELTFTARHTAIEEPRFISRHGPRTYMDYTRLTQNMDASGEFRIDGQRRALAGWQGTRDRSWGVRPIGAADSQPVAPPPPPQFYWVWAPLNFGRYATFFHSNEYADGVPWNRAGVLVDLQSGAEVKFGKPAYEFTYRKGSRRVDRAVLHGELPAGPVTITLTAGAEFQMQGIGYGHPQYGHGLWRGELDVQSERLRHADISMADPAQGHIQALVTAEMRLPDGSVHQGRGILEQLFLGPHAPSGFRDVFDPA